MAVRFIHDALPAVLRKYSSLMVYMLIMIFLAVVFLNGITLVRRTLSQISPTLSLPMGLVYICIPLGALLMAIQVLALLQRIWLHGSIDVKTSPPQAPEGG
jgi:TRAP-type C4-dicarboxylate transport system permease small subunit